MSCPNVSVRNLPGFGIPEFDFAAVSYVGSTNNIASVSVFASALSDAAMKRAHHAAAYSFKIACN